MSENIGEKNPSWHLRLSNLSTVNTRCVSSNYHYTTTDIQKTLGHVGAKYVVLISFGVSVSKCNEAAIKMCCVHCIGWKQQRKSWTREPSISRLWALSWRGWDILTFSSWLVKLRKHSYYSSQNATNSIILLGPLLLHFSNSTAPAFMTSLWHHRGYRGYPSSPPEPQEKCY